MSDAEFAARRNALAGRLAAAKAGAILVSAIPNIRYLTGFTGSNGMLLLRAGGGAFFFTDPRYDFQAKREVGCPVEVCKGPLIAAVARAVARSRIRRLGFEATRLGFDAWESLQSKVKARLVAVRGIVEELRTRKSPAEIDRIRKAVLTNSRAFKNALPKIRPGRTSENDLAAEIDYQMRKLGAEKPAFDTIVASGERSALPHAHPTAAVLKPNQLLLIDMGATQDGYASDMTRMVFLGTPGARVKKLHRAVLEAQLAALDAVRPGVTAGFVDAQARKVLRGHGLDRAFMHSTGHGLGLEIHERPRLGKREKTRLEEGMAVTIEPGAYLDGFCGVRIEDTVVVTSQGCEVLTPTSKDLLEI